MKCNHIREGRVSTTTKGNSVKDQYNFLNQSVIYVCRK